MLQTTQSDIPEGFIDLGIGHPSLELLPTNLLADAARHRLHNGDAELLQYGAERGDAFFRVELNRFLAQHYGMELAAEELFITCGASQSLDLLCHAYTKPGDTIFAEEPSYFLGLDIFRDHGLNVIGIPIDAQGIRVDLLAEQLAHTSPIFLYTIPTYHNPASVTLSAERREALVRLSEAHNFLIVADEVYHLLNFQPPLPPPPLIHYDTQGTVLSLGSFSKILAPGLRLGWIQSEPRLVDPLINSGLMLSGGGLNPFTSGIVRSILELDLLEKNLADLKSVYRSRATALAAALQQQIPEAKFSAPAGGFFIWLQLPDGVDAYTLEERAEDACVRVKLGSRFSSQDGLANFIRLSFSFYDIPQLVEGVKRLAKAIR